jgi:hypothetical protein
MAYNIPQIDIGQGGGAYLDDTGAFVPPTGKVITAVNVVAANTSFTTLTPANAVGTYYPGTAVTATAAGNGANAEAIVSGDNFPAGQWIYGRFSACTLADGAVFLYFGEE